MRPSAGKIVQDLLILLPSYEIFKNPIVFPDDGKQRITTKLIYLKVLSKENRGGLRLASIDPY